MNDLVQQLNAVKPKHDNAKYKAEAKAIGASALEFALAGKKAKEETKAVKTQAKAVDQEAKKALAEAKAKAKQEALAVKQAKAEAKAKEVKPPKGPTIASQTIDLILNTTKTNLEILAEIQANNAGCKTSYACIAWYRSKLRNEGKLAPRYPAKTVEA